MLLLEDRLWAEKFLLSWVLLLYGELRMFALLLIDFRFDFGRIISKLPDLFSPDWFAEIS